MTQSKEKAFQKIAELVSRFAEHVEEYKHSNYNEHQPRVDYINPFFKALGWDMDNEQGFAEAYREVIHEDKVKVGKATKAPDYAFTLFGQRKFFVDAKKPSIRIKDDIAPAYQVRRYGWSAKVPISIVTDFEEFAIYDCTKKPKPMDKASVARIKYLTFDQYLDEFDLLWNVFAKENLPKGRFDCKLGQPLYTQDKIDFGRRLSMGMESVKEIVGKIWIYVLAGIAIGAGAHGYVPDEFLACVLGAQNWYSVLIAIVVGIPLYSNATGIIPIVSVLIEKGVSLGTALAFMMSVIGLSLPPRLLF